LKIALIIVTVIALCILAGCNGAVEEKQRLSEGKELFTVDFQEGQTLRYKFASSRQTSLDWASKESKSKRGKDAVDKFSESMDMVIVYTPIEVNPYGLTTIKATCESVRVKVQALRTYSNGDEKGKRCYLYA